MPTIRAPRKGSLQFWPRKRASKFLPRVNWDAIKDSKGLKGFICYKAGMASCHVKDKTPNSMTKDKKIAVPVTILECPPMEVFSVRFYKNGRVAYEVLSEVLDKNLKRKVKVPKKKGKKIEEVKIEYDDIRIIAYPQVKKAGLKKKPDFIEIGLVGSVEEKLNLVKKYLGKEIAVTDVFDTGQLIDIRGLTKGKGFQGPIKRFGIQLRQYKSEKGRRRPGSIGPWHPARVTFRVPMAGQLGMFTRVIFNNKIIDLGKSEGKLKNIKNYGDIKTDYIIVYGSVQGSPKRALIATAPLRENKKQRKKDFEFIELVK